MEAISAPVSIGHDDEELVDRARADNAVFAELYVRHREAVFRYLRARTASDDEAVELAAVTFERAFAALPRYRARGGGFLAWLFRIARNATVDERRRPRPAPMPIDIVSSTGESPEARALAVEQRERLQYVVARLPGPQRDAVALRYGAGLTARETGLVIGKSEAATQKLISRALARLREDFDER